MDDQLQVIQNPEQTYNSIRQSIVQAQRTMAAAVNSAMVTAEFGQGYTVRNLRAMRQFYCCFLIRHTLCAELG